MNTTVAIIGANSFLAHELINELISKDFKINAADYEEAPQWLLQHENLKWIKLRSDCLEDIKNVCEDVDTLFYLPHQSIRTQGFYTDHQLNFLMLQTHWLTSFANTSSIKKIIYVSSMMQKDDLKGLLFQNRFNMENILKDGKAPVIVLRLPLLLMNSSEDFEFILKTLKRYPFVFLPTWIEKQVQPIFVKDVVEILVQLQLDNAYTKINRNINLPGPNLISYFSFFKQIIKKYKLRCSIITTNLLPSSFFYFFLSLFSRNTFSQIQRKFECWNQDAVV